MKATSQAAQERAIRAAARHGYIPARTVVKPDGSVVIYWTRENASAPGAGRNPWDESDWD